MIPLPLQIRLRSTMLDRGTPVTGPEVSITSRVRDLVIRSTAPGGYASVECALDHPYVFSPNELAVFSAITVYDSRSGRTVGEGYLEDPNRTSGPDGQVWNLVAYGPAAHASDVEFPIVYVDRRFPDQPFGSTNGQLSTGPDPGLSGNDAMILTLPDGTHVNSSPATTIRGRYTTIAECGQKVARIDYVADTGNSDTNHHLQCFAHTSGGAFDTPRDQAFSAAGLASSPKVVITDWANGRNMFDIAHVRVAGGASTIPNDTYWASVWGLVMVAMRYNANGVEKTTGYTINGVKVSDVVADLLGRPGVVPLYDGTNAKITTTSFVIDQAAWEDGATFAKIMEDLAVLDPSTCWLAWERGFGTKHRFELVTWPTTVRYEATVADGWSSPASNAELFNEVSVRWKDARGRTRSTLRTQTVPQLGTRKRRSIVDLGDTIGSDAAATAAGDAFLADHASPPNAGTLTVARPIRDLVSGRLVAPWEIRPASLIRIRDVFPNIDPLNASKRDGAAVFVVKSATFTASQAATSLELDSYSRTVARALSDLTRRATIRRR